MTPASLRILRYAMLTGVLLFGAVAYYQSTHRPPDDGTTDLATLRWSGYGLCAAVMVGLSVVRRARERADSAMRSTYALIGSALAEGAALMGGVYLFLGGGFEIWALGVILLLATFTLLPADPEAT
jgi:predicted MFS family arabinose efflux permease